MKNIIVVGANSSIVKECLWASAAGLESVALCGRDVQGLRALADDLRARYPGLRVKFWECDALNVSLAASVWSEMESHCLRVDQVLIAPGILGDQRRMELEPLQAYELLRLNSAAVSLWVLMAANMLERQKHGTLAVITSVAGMRGRRSNYIYGSSKAQLIALLAGLRCRLAAAGVKVVDFRPGMVDTPMTAGVRKGLLMASAKSVGADLAIALERQEGVIYSPKFWRPVMLVIKAIPYAVFKKLKF